MDNKKLITSLVVFVIVFVLLVIVIVGTVSFDKVNDGENSSYESSLEANESNVESVDSSFECSENVFSEESFVISESSVEVLIPQLILPPDVALVSQNVLVFSTKYDSVVFEKNADVEAAPASITKLLTALVVLDHLKPDTVLRVGSEIELVKPNSSTAWLYKDQYLSVEQLIDALLIPSGNDAAYTLAVNTADFLDDSGKRMENAAAVEAFVKLMNDKAKELGCENTLFCSPDGYDTDGQVTTARDLLIISRAAYANEIIRASVSKGKAGSWENSNALIREDSRFYNKLVTGLKTGSTGDAGFCVSVSAELGEDTLFIVLLGSPTQDGRFSDANKIIDAMINDGVVMLPQ